MAVAAAMGATLTFLYATSCFVPRVPFESPYLTYDAFRYDFMAHAMSRWPVERILTDEVVSLKEPGYARLLAVLYSFVGHEPILGCAANWGLWLAAGLLLVPVAADRHPRGRRVGAVFLILWMLVPEAVDWSGTTSKEPLCAFLLALSLWLARAAERAGPLRLALVVGSTAAVAAVATEIRSAVVLLSLLPIAIVCELRVRRSTMPWAFAVTLFGLTASFLGLAGNVAEAITKEDFAKTGSAFAHGVWAAGYSSDSVLLRIGSENRWLDLLAVPVRGLAHIAVPLNTSPWTLPLAQVAAPSLLVWASAATYTGLAIAMGLRLRDRLRRPAAALPSMRVALICTSLSALFLLGITGIIHERYRSILLPAFLPLGVPSLLDELREHGATRMATVWTLGGMLVAVAYAGLKYVF
jgi:hypothetical protein